MRFSRPHSYEFRTAKRGAMEARTVCKARALDFGRLQAGHVLFTAPTLPLFHLLLNFFHTYRDRGGLARGKP